jgi:hypothetical protein
MIIFKWEKKMNRTKRKKLLEDIINLNPALTSIHDIKELLKNFKIKKYILKEELYEITITIPFLSYIFKARKLRKQFLSHGIIPIKYNVTRKKLFETWNKK